MFSKIFIIFVYPSNLKNLESVAAGNTSGSEFRFIPSIVLVKTPYQTLVSVDVNICLSKSSPCVPIKFHFRCATFLTPSVQ